LSVIVTSHTDLNHFVNGASDPGQTHSYPCRGVQVRGIMDRLMLSPVTLVNTDDPICPTDHHGR